MKTENYLKKIVEFAAHNMSDLDYKITGFTEDRYGMIRCYIKFSLENRNYERVLVFRKPADKRRQVEFVKSRDIEQLF